MGPPSEKLITLLFDTSCSLDCFQSEIPFTGNKKHCSQSSACPGAISFLLRKGTLEKEKSFEIAAVVAISVKGNLLAT